ncbi:MAG: S8 family serine peptidase [Oligoflexia bacterium]|nr:S8 family serine peptidase [Oligoflexia bacterium]
MPLLMSLPLSLLAAPALALSPRRPLPPMALHAVKALDLPDTSLQLTIKLRDDVRGRATAAGSIESLSHHDLAQIRALATAKGLRFAPLIHLSQTTVDGLEQRAAARSGRSQPDLGGMLQVLGPVDPADLLAIGQALQQLDAVEYAFVGPSIVPPPEDIGTETPDYRDLQGYLDSAPGVGAWSAWAEGITGEGVLICDVEYGWRASHEDLVDRDLHQESGQTVPTWVADYGWDEHGTAVMGELAGVDNKYGVTGGALGVTIQTFPEYSNEEGSRRPTAIAAAIAAAQPGDIVLLEMQTVTRPGGDYGPAELDPNVFTVVQTAADAGVTVVGAGGNGAQDLDSDWYAANYMDWGDSGAILVGAGTPDTAHDSYDYSTYGDRINLQGWGASVVTLAYGDLASIDDDPDQRYTSLFAGTSSATPIVALSAALVQSYAINSLGGPLDPGMLRDLLVYTGVPQGTGGHIGPLPDIMAAIDALDLDRDGLTALAWGGTDADADGDGFDSQSDGGTDCDDADAAVSPDATELPDDGIDNNCNGSIDEADSGTTTGTTTGSTDSGFGDGGSGDGGSGDGGSSPGCAGCSAVHPAPAPWFLLPGLLALIRRRRR